MQIYKCLRALKQLFHFFSVGFYFLYWPQTPGDSRVLITIILAIFNGNFAGLLERYRYTQPSNCDAGFGHAEERLIIS